MSGSGGGGGYEYQAQATAYIATHILAKRPLHWFDCISDFPVTVAAETDGPGDDIRITLQSGAVIEIQAKHGLKKDEKFWEAIVKLIRGLVEDSSLYGVLLTDSRASSPIRDQLREDIIRLGQGREDNLKTITTEVIDRLSKEGVPYGSEILKRFRIVVVDLDDSIRNAKIALEVLSKVLQNPEQEGQAWSILCNDGLDLIKKRGQRNAESLSQLLGRSNIQLASLQTTSLKKGIDWQQVCRDMLDLQKKLSTNEVIASEAMQFDLLDDEIFVSLALVERKEPDQLSQDIHPSRSVECYEEKPSIEYEAFREQVLRQRKSDRIAIIGEPGAGKTTLLQHIAFWILEQQLGLPIWISLGDLIKSGDLQRLKDYLTQVWLEDAILNVTEEAKSDFLNQLAHQRVWLLLDGADEIVASSGIALREIHNQLGSWLSQSSIVLTCRVNVWDADINALGDFQTYRTKKFHYPTQVERFIRNGFRKSNQPSGERLKTELAKTEHARLQQLIRNPLRLMMLCTTWHEQESLPATKAELYGRFVDEFYKWNKAKWKKKDLSYALFPNTKAKQEKLNQSLGRLACRALDKEAAPFRLPHNLVFDELGDPEDDGSDFWLALNLGWLQVARNSNKSSEKVYTFFHPTFQEYFAALAIDDWDYFLPRDHKDKPTRNRKGEVRYRIFETQWQEVILLWLGRSTTELEDEQKEAFMQALVDFQDGCNNEKIYKYKSYFLAVAGTSEYQFKRSSEIIIQAFNWGYYCDEVTTSDIPFLQNARLSITSANRKILIDILVEILLSEEGSRLYIDAVKLVNKLYIVDAEVLQALSSLMRTTSDERIHCEVAFTLAKVFKTYEAINALINLLRSEVFCQAAQYLEELNIRSAEITTTLEETIKSKLYDIWFATDVYIATRVLLRIEPNNVIAKESLGVLRCKSWINSLESLSKEALEPVDYDNQQKSSLEKLKLRPSDYRALIHQLEELGIVIDSSIINIINSLTNLICSSSDKQTRSKATWCLEVIVTGDLLAIEVSLLPEIVKRLKTCFDGFLERKIIVSFGNMQEPHIGCSKVLWYCAQNMNYPDFYQAWHNFPSITTKLHVNDRRIKP